MTPLAPLMMFGWVPLAIVFFSIYSAHRAVMVIVIGGVLFLPEATYNLPGIPPYTKQTAIALGLILGGRLTGVRSTFFFKPTKYDVPIFIEVAGTRVVSLNGTPMLIRPGVICDFHVLY